MNFEKREKPSQAENRGAKKASLVSEIHKLENEILRGTRFDCWNISDGTSIETADSRKKKTLKREGRGLGQG